MNLPRVPIRVCVAIGIAMSVALLPPPRRTTAQGQLTLKVATSFDARSPWGAALQRVAQHVQQGSHGKIRVRVFYEGALGTDQEQAARVAAGTLQAFAGPIDALTKQTSALRALETPFLFRSDRDVASKLERSRERITSLLSASGLRLGQWLHGGFRSRVSIANMQTPMLLTMVDVFARGFDRRVQRVTHNREALAAGVLVYSQRWFDGLPAQTQVHLTRIPAELDAALRSDVERTEAALLAAAKQRGVEVVEHETRAAEQRQAIEAHVSTLDDAGRALYRQLSAP